MFISLFINVKGTLATQNHAATHCKRILGVIYTRDILGLLVLLLNQNYSPTKILHVQTLLTKFAIPLGLFVAMVIFFRLTLLKHKKATRNKSTDKLQSKNRTATKTKYRY